jgi:trehalose/maltose hydrolase-like predicted phosphorylase
MSEWVLSYEGYDKENEMLREALTTTGNGYFCTRGAAEWADCSEDHYPGTYMHGGFDRAITIMAGRPVVNEDLVNMPNWLPLKMSIEDTEPFSLDSVEILSYRHEFDLKRCLLTRDITFRDKEGRETHLVSRRFVSMQKMHLGAIEWQITPLNWSGTINIMAALDGRVINWGVPRYRALESKHLQALKTAQVGKDGISLLVRTLQSHIFVAEAARTKIFKGTEEVDANRDIHQQDDYIQQTISFNINEKETMRVEKMCSFYTSKDSAISEPLVNAQQAIERFCDFETGLTRHENAWAHMWSMCDFKLPRDEEAQKLLRFHSTHVLMCCSPFTADLDAGVPARGLTGEPYRGHIFWDELYIYPFLNFRLPEITRELLMYRYRRMDEARELARSHGYEGAMYPWQSGSDGREETQVVHLNPKDGKWHPDLSHNQRHVNAAIFHNIWQYYQATGDVDFLWSTGSRMMMEIARFWASISTFNKETGRYEIHGVMGPDEYHEAYPDSDEHGLRNNSYTNIMVAWIFQVTLEVLEMMHKKRRVRLMDELGLDEEEIIKWKDMSYKMFVPFHEDDIISQFEGYEKLKEFDWEGYRKKYGNIQRLDRILKAEGKNPNDYKLAKQADTLMLFFLFNDVELKNLLSRLGYDYTPEMKRRNIDYYLARTSHGSTLSFIVHANILADIDIDASWDMFKQALASDYGDIQGGTTREGIHMGVMAGTLDLMQRGYLGTEIYDGTLFFNPKTSDLLEGLTFRMTYRKAPLKVQIIEGKINITVEANEYIDSVKIGVNNQMREIKVGETCQFEYILPDNKRQKTRVKETAAAE